jgi:hypothetical protein
MNGGVFFCFYCFFDFIFTLKITLLGSKTRRPQDFYLIELMFVAYLSVLVGEIFLYYDFMIFLYMGPLIFDRLFKYPGGNSIISFMSTY